MMKRNGSVRIRALTAAVFLVLTAGCRWRTPDEETVGLYLKAKRSYEAGDLAEAKTLFLRITGESTRFYQARFMLGKTLFFLGEYGEAERQLNRTLRLRPDYREAELYLIRLLMYTGRHEEANARLRRLLAVDSADPRLLYIQATVFHREERLAEALEYLKKSALYGEEFARVFLDLGRLYYLFGREEDAARHLETSLALLPEGSVLARPVEELYSRIRDNGDTSSGGVAE